MNAISRIYPMFAIWLAFAGRAVAVEIYYAPVTPAEIASGLVKDRPDGVAADGTKLRSVSGPGLSSASEAGGIRLTESAISPVTATALGYAAADGVGLGASLTSLTEASNYRYGLGQGGENAPWNIQFDAVPPPSQGSVPAANFDPTKIDVAINLARVSIRANPYRTGPGSGYDRIFQAAYEKTVPYTYAGNEWRARAEKERVGNTPANASPDTRIGSLETACTRYRSACEPFLALLNHELESAWLLNPAAFIGSAGPAWMPPVPLEGGGTRSWTWADLLYQAYVEAVTQYSEAQFERLYIRYLRDYSASDQVLTDLIAEIQTRAAEIERLMLPVSALQAAGVLINQIDTSAPSGNGTLLRRLSDHVAERSLFFSPGANPLSNNRISYSTYGPNYIPFLVPAQLASKPFSFDNIAAFTHGNGQDLPPVGAVADSNSLVGQAKTADSTAMTAVDEAIRTATQLDLERAQAREKYEAQLSQLCGQRRSDPADLSSPLVPDLAGYLLPTENRDPLLFGESLGDIALQWGKIDQADTRLLSAYRALAEIDEEAEIIRQYGEERLLSYDRIARIQLSTGEQISALDYLSGEIRAQAILDESEQRAKQAEKKSWFAAVAKVVAVAALAYVTGGTAVAALGLSAKTWAATKVATSGGLGVIDSLNSAKSQAEMHRNIGRIQADAAKRQADITAQQTRIRAMEGAQITMEQSGQEANRIREAIQKLMIRVERQKLEILLAKQQLEFAELEHANMIGRISWLLEEYRRDSIRQASGLLNRPDVRIRRDYQIEEAARMFRVAQEYSFLCARAARYRFAGKTSDPFLARILAEEQNILRAQNAVQLEKHVGELIKIRGEFLSAISGTGGLSDLREVRFSIRDLVAQSNSYFAIDGRDTDGREKLTGGYSVGDLQPFPASISPSAATVVALSDAQFTQFLKKVLQPIPGSTSRKLQIAFPIGFEPSYGERNNPLRTKTVGEYGHLIEGPGVSYISSSAVGAFLNVRISREVNSTQFPTNGVIRQEGVSWTTSQMIDAEDKVYPSGALRTWALAEKASGGFQNAPIRILRNKDTANIVGWRSNFQAELDLANVGFQLHERSPANDRWVIEITTSGTNWDRFIDYIRDIELCMTVRGWAN